MQEAGCLHTFAARQFNTNFSIPFANPSSSFVDVTQVAGGLHLRTRVTHYNAHPALLEHQNVIRMSQSWRFPPSEY